MFRTKFFTVRFIVASIFVLLLSATAYAFAADNTVDASKAGDGAGAISGYTVTNIKYTHDSSDREKIGSVSFDVGSTADDANVFARFTDGAATPAPVSAWSGACTFATNRYSCTFATAVDAKLVKSLQVVASSK